MLIIYMLKYPLFKDPIGWLFQYVHVILFIDRVQKKGSHKYLNPVPIQPLTLMLYNNVYGIFPWRLLINQPMFMESGMIPLFNDQDGHKSSFQSMALILLVEMLYEDIPASAFQEHREGNTVDLHSQENHSIRTNVYSYCQVPLQWISILVDRQKTRISRF